MISVTGSDLAHSGAKQVASNNSEWMESCYEAILLTAFHRREFTADDVRATLDAPPHPNCIGAAFRNLSHDGLIVRIGYRQSTTPSTHARVVSVWRGR